jgi:hypothetical protein
MKTHKPRSPLIVLLTGMLLAALALPAGADVITDWNQRSAQLIGEARIGTPPAVRVMALVQTAAYEAAREAAHSAPTDPRAVDAAVAAAHRSAFIQLMPAQRVAVDAAYQSALATLPENAARTQHLAIGERAAQRVLAQRATDMPRTPDTYRPHATPGIYVPTTIPAAPQWAQRRPWMLERADQFRPGPPPALTSERWARDLNEVKALGGRDSSKRSAEQTEIGRFWDYSLPAVYHGLVRSVAMQSGRDVVANARLFATVAQAMDDALIAVFDAKYTYNLWRPITAIRNGDVDGHDGTDRDAAWVPLIDTPAHPEYPCAHCILAATVAAIVKAEVRDRPLPDLTTSSPTAQGVARRWNSTEAFVQEVALARIVGGVHFRTSTEVGLAMGQHIGEWAVSRSASADH